jgi:hypothetical protein
LSDFDQNWNVTTDYSNTSQSEILKTRSLVLQLVQRAMAKLMGAFMQLLVVDSKKEILYTCTNSWDESRGPTESFSKADENFNPTILESYSECLDKTNSGA